MSATIAHNISIEIFDPLADQTRRYIYGSGFNRFLKPVIPDEIRPSYNYKPLGYIALTSLSGTPWNIVVSRLYRVSMGHNLLGSLKTKRLRKKRNKALSNWLTRR